MSLSADLAALEQFSQKFMRIPGTDPLQPQTPLDPASPLSAGLAEAHNHKSGAAHTFAADTDKEVVAVGEALIGVGDGMNDQDLLNSSTLKRYLGPQIVTPLLPGRP